MVSIPPHHINDLLQQLNERSPFQSGSNIIGRRTSTTKVYRPGSGQSASLSKIGAPLTSAAFLLAILRQALLLLHRCLALESKPLARSVRRGGKRRLREPLGLRRSRCGGCTRNSVEGSREGRAKLALRLGVGVLGIKVVGARIMVENFGKSQSTAVPPFEWNRWICVPVISHTEFLILVSLFGLSNQ